MTIQAQRQRRVIGHAKNGDRSMRLYELRTRTLQWFQDQYPNIPDYVVKDFIYKNYKDDPKSMDTEFGLWLNDLKWTKGVYTITFDFFDDETQKLLKPRMEGKRLQFIQNDDERHNTQWELLKKRGPSTEPIIMTKLEGEYELQEGWHRTVQSLLLWPQGYKQVAWVGEEQ